MKNKIKFLSIKALLYCALLFITSCDLSIKDDFDFKDELGPEVKFEMTAWEWVQTRTTPGITLASQANGEYFDYMIEAIKKADMIDEYNQMSTIDRTYLMLDNNAFTGSGDVIQLVTGSASVGAAETVTQVLADANVARLQKMLKYHIVTTYITQRDPLINYGVEYQFQTLIPGTDGIIIFERNERLAISINDSETLPSTRAPENVRNHNYVFNNGIGHTIADYVRVVPF